MNLPLVVINGDNTYVRYINRIRHVKVHAAVPLTGAQIEEFRVKPTLYCSELPPEPRVTA